MVRKAVAGFGPERFQTTNNITRTVKATTIEKYPSRDKFEMAHNNVSLVNFCTISISRTNLYYTIFRWCGTKIYSTNFEVLISRY